MGKYDRNVVITEIRKLGIKELRNCVSRYEGCNALRLENRVEPQLRIDPKLAEAAMVRTREMANAGELTHTRTDGSKYDTVVKLGRGAVIGEKKH